MPYRCDTAGTYTCYNLHFNFIELVNNKFTAF